MLHCEPPRRATAAVGQIRSPRTDRGGLPGTSVDPKIPDPATAAATQGRSVPPTDLVTEGWRGDGSDPRRHMLWCWLHQLCTPISPSTLGYSAIASIH